MAFACFKGIVKFPEAAGDVFLDMLTRGTFLKLPLEWQIHVIHSQVRYYHATEDKLSPWLAKWTLIRASRAQVAPGSQCTHMAKTHRPLAPQPTVLRGHLVMMLTCSERLVTGGPKQDKTSTDVRCQWRPTWPQPQGADACSTLRHQHISSSASLQQVARKLLDPCVFSRWVSTEKRSQSHRRREETSEEQTHIPVRWNSHLGPQLLAPPTGDTGSLARLVSFHDSYHIPSFLKPTEH